MFSVVKGLYNSLWLQRLLTLITVVMMLWLLGPQLESYGWWVVVVAVMVLLLEYLAFYRGVEYGIKTFNSMSKKDQMKLMQILEGDNEHSNPNEM